MKCFNRIVAALLAALMLCGTCTTVAEMDVELNLNAQRNSGDIELEIAPGAEANETGGGLALDDSLQMEGIDLLALNLEIEIDSDFPIDGAEAQRAELVQSNDSDSDFEIDEKGVLTDYNGNDSDVVIPDGVTAIESYAFAGCDTITSVIIPKSVKKIKGFAFHGCKRLTSVLIPGNVISIGERAFGECHNLTNKNNYRYDVIKDEDSLSEVTLNLKSEQTHQ